MSIDLPFLDFKVTISKLDLKLLEMRNKAVTQIEEAVFLNCTQTSSCGENRCPPQADEAINADENTLLKISLQLHFFFRFTVD